LIPCITSVRADDLMHRRRWRRGHISAALRIVPLGLLSADLCQT